MISNCSMALMPTRPPVPSLRKASTAGAWTISQSRSENARQARKMTPNPARARMRRVRSSWRCSRKDMRSRPSSSLVSCIEFPLRAGTRITPCVNTGTTFCGFGNSALGNALAPTVEGWRRTLSLPLTKCHHTKAVSPDGLMRRLAPPLRLGFGFRTTLVIPFGRAKKSGRRDGLVLAALRLRKNHSLPTEAMRGRLLVPERRRSLSGFLVRRR